MLPPGMAVLKDRSVVGSCVISVAEKLTVLVINYTVNRTKTHFKYGLL